jgi:hypothetical protein
MSYELQIAFTNEQIQQLYSMNLQVVVAKGITQLSGSYQIVVWQAFRPFPANDLQWQPSYGLYATTQINGQVTLSITYPDAVPGHTYVLNANGSITPATAQAPPTAYNLANHYGSPMTVGLSQAALLNGTSQPASAVNMVGVGPNFTVSLLPSEQLTLYVAGQYDATTNSPIWITNGQVLTIPDPMNQGRPSAPAPIVTVSPGTPLTVPAGTPLKVSYDSSTSQFVPQA